MPVKKNTRITHGNPYVKSIICECAWSTIRMRDTYLSKFYWKIKQRRGAKKAVIALSRKIMIVIYNLLKYKVVFNEQKFEDIRIKQETMKLKRITTEAKKLGYNLIAMEAS